MLVSRFPAWRRSQGGSQEGSIGIHRAKASYAPVPPISAGPEPALAVSLSLKGGDRSKCKESSCKRSLHGRLLSFTKAWQAAQHPRRQQCQLPLPHPSTASPVVWSEQLRSASWASTLSPARGTTRPTGPSRQAQEQSGASDSSDTVSRTEQLLNGVACSCR